MLSPKLTRATDQTPRSRTRFQSALSLGYVALILGGCATLSESQCVAGDWRTVGHSDGAAGEPSSRLLKHTDACARHGIYPDESAYQAGWDEGVIQYCTPENGFSEGERGADYQNVCPTDSVDGFYRSYLAGRDIYLQQQALNELENSISFAESRIDELDDDIHDLERELVHAEDAPVRRRLVRKIREKRDEQRDLEDDLQEYLGALADARSP